MLIASAILALSLLMLVRFAVAYCHSIVAAERPKGLLPLTLRMADLELGTPTARDFHRIMRLVALCPFESHDRGALRTVRVYFLLLGALGALRVPAPVWWRWIRAERARCAQFAAAALDRRVRTELATIT